MPERDALIIIGIVTVGSYTFKLFGLLLSSRVANEGNMRIILDSLPAMLLVSLVVPFVIKEGITGIVAVLLIFLCLSKTKNALAAMVMGIVWIAISRQLIA